MATAASTAFPPMDKILYPDWVANCWLDATMPRVPMTTDLCAKLLNSLFCVYENRNRYLRDERIYACKLFMIFAYKDGKMR